MSRPDHDLEELGVGPAEADRLRRALGALTDEDHARVDPPPEVGQALFAALTEEEATPAAPSAPVVRLDEHRARRSRRLLVGAVAAALLVVGGLTAVLLGDDASTGGPELVASTDLRALGPAGESATAAVDLVATDDHYELVLEAEGMAPPPEGHHYELWLLDPASPDAEPVSLGAMDGSTTVVVPEGVDPRTYEVVDVSIQDAGQVEHSGDSLLRGTLA